MADLSNMLALAYGKGGNREFVCRNTEPGRREAEIFTSYAAAKKRAEEVSKIYSSVCIVRAEDVPPLLLPSHLRRRRT